MKQTLEEAAKEHQNSFPTCEDESVLGAFSNGMHHQSYKSFITGAEWYAKQYPWINVEERLPETNDGQSLYEVIVVTSDRRFLVVINTEVEHLVGLLGVTHWMPIPSLMKYWKPTKMY